ncbi:MAG: sensor histidine kinase, partial [Paraclostridium sp.]
MKWKITFKYVLTIIMVVIIVTGLNFIALFSFIAGTNQRKYEQPEEVFAREFSKYIKSKNGEIYISTVGIKQLDNRQVWIQILDENGKEVYNYKKPDEISDKHTPMGLINGYKYAGGFSHKNSDNILVSDKIIDDIQYTYIIGFERIVLEKIIYTYNAYSMINILKQITIWVFVADIIVALIFGYIFSKRLINPMKTIISGVENLEDGKYEIYYKEKGLYKDVYKKLNKLAITLKKGETERCKTDNMRQEWIANISHDIKTPLSSIKGYAELLSEDYEINIDEISEYGKIINSKADYIKELVDDLNLTMKLKNSKSILNKETTNLVSVVRNTVIDILNDPKYSNRDIEFICNKEIINISIDISLIKRLISNLLYNAIVHNDEDIKIYVNLHDEREEIYIQINDNGKGIYEEDLKYIFERYYRGTNTGEVHKGSGLGMAI